MIKIRSGIATAGINPQLPIPQLPHPTTHCPSKDFNNEYGTLNESGCSRSLKSSSTQLSKQLVFINASYQKVLANLGFLAFSPCILYFFFFLGGPGEV